ncbi:MAG: hypothetical protein JRD94_14570 [Deltaproteobacteria bacterium]|nr:hypothetical protein [Deltaproteobacteria bacterium]
MATKFTPEIRTTIIEALRENPSLPSAAVKAGIQSSTLRTWIERGEMGDPVYSQFVLDCAEARQTMKNDIVAALLKTALDELHPQQTKAAHRLLTNLFPQEFANVKHTVSHKSEKGDAIDLSGLPTEELRAFHKTLKRIMDTGKKNDAPVGEPRKAAQAIDVVNGKP